MKADSQISQTVSVMFRALCWGVAALAISSCDSAEEPLPVNPDPFCEARPRLVFCEDFDTAKPPGVFDTRHVDGGSLARTRDEVASIPYALQAKTPAGRAGSAVLRKTFGPSRAYRIFLFMRVATPNADAGDVELLSISIETGSTPYRIGLGARGDGSWWAHETRGDAVRRFDLTEPFGFDAWRTARFDYEVLDSGKGQLHVRFGSETALLVDDLTPVIDVAPPTFELGPVSRSAAAWQAYYDNITFEMD